MIVEQKWTPRVQLIADNYRKAFVAPASTVSIKNGMIELRVVVESEFIPVFRDYTPKGQMGDSGKLAQSTQITSFIIDGLNSSIDIGQPAENRSGNPYWTFVEDGRRGEVAPQGPDGKLALFWDELGHPVGSVAPAAAQPYILAASQAATAAIRPSLQLVAERMLGRMLKEWKRGI